MPAGERRLLWASYAAMACIGLYAGATGPSLGTIAGQVGVSLGNAGLVVTALAAGSMSASASVALWLHRRRQRMVAVVGLALMATGFLGMAFAETWPLFLAASFTTGLGGGLADSGGHALAAASSRPAVAVSHLNSAFAAGAFIGPAWAGTLLEIGEWRWAVFAGLAVAALGALALMAAAPDVQARAVRPARPGLAGIPPIVALLSLTLFLYVGAEAGLGAWTASATREAADASLLAGALVTSGYWGALFLGRVVSGMLIERGTGPMRVLAVSIVGAGAGSVALALGGDVLAIGAVAAVATGFCFGPIWPGAMSVASRDSPANTPAVLITVGNGGGIVLPWTQGQVLAESGTRAGMGTSAALCLGMLLLVAAAGRLRPGRDRGPRA